MPRVDPVGNALRGVPSAETALRGVPNDVPASTTERDGARSLQARDGVRSLQVEVSCDVRRSFRVSQVEGMFDLPERETASERFSAELPDENEPWQIGLIVGPSGSGKTTIARAAYGELDGARRWPRDRAVVDCFGRRSIKEITAMLDGRRLQFAPGVGQAVSRPLPRRAIPLRSGAGTFNSQAPHRLRRVHQRRRSHGRPHRLRGGGENRAADECTSGFPA